MVFLEKDDIKIQFLEEAEDYIQILESGLLGIANNLNHSENIDNILRAAHSLKGGAAMMDFPVLSQFSHQLEDFLKIIKLGKVSVNSDVENLFLTIAFNLGADDYFSKPFSEQKLLQTMTNLIRVC